MRTEWCYYPKALTDEQCDQLIQVSEQLPAFTGTIKVQGFLQAVEDTRRSTVTFLDYRRPETSWLFDMIWQLVRHSNETYFNNFDITSLEYVQIASYRDLDKGEYTQHQDVIWTDHNWPLQRKISVTAQLTDPSTYDGGDFVFRDLQSGKFPDKEAIRQRGTVIVFPSFIPHAVLPVTRGIRHSVTAWIEGPNWR